MNKSIPLPQSEPTTPTLSGASSLDPPSIKAERANAIAARAERANAIAARADPSGLVPSTEWDGQIHAGWAPYISTVNGHFGVSQDPLASSGPSFANLFLQAVEREAFARPEQAEASSHLASQVRRPCYNHFRWPSPLPRLVALEAGLTTNKRCKHTDAIALLARRLHCTPEAFYEMSRGEVSERLFGKPNYYAPASYMGVRKLLAQTSRYY